MVISPTVLKIATASLAIVVLFLGYRGRTTPGLRRCFYGLLAVTAAADVALALRVSLLAVKAPPLWDFMCFRVYALAAAKFHDPYSPAALMAVAHGIPGTRSFTAEVLAPGMLYPPPAILLFYPLGLRDPHAAALAWWSSLLAAEILLTVIVARVCFQEGADRVAAIIAVWAFPPILETIDIGQTMIFATLAAALFLFDRNTVRRGIWLTLAFIAKPVVLPLALYSIIRRECNTLAASVITLAVLSIASLLLITPKAFASYFISNPILRVPGSLYRENAYQSLFSFVIRLSGDTSAHYHFYEQYPFMILSIVLIAVTIWCCYVLPLRERALALSLLICAGLIVYPATLYFYGTLMLIPMAVCWRLRTALPGGTVTVGVFWAVEAACQSLGMNGAFWGFVLGWFFFAFVTVWYVLRDRAGAKHIPSPAVREVAL